MNPRQPLTCPPNGSGASMPCAQVWSTLNPHQRETIQQALLRVCCQLASLSQCPVVSEGSTPPAASSMEVAHE
jgi:hypothetical protein